jgi:hypothetical protein
MGGLPYCGFIAMANGVIRVVHVHAQPAKRFFHWENFKLASGCSLQFNDPTVPYPRSRHG